MMDIQKKSNSQHETRIFHVLVFILLVQSQNSVNPSSAYICGAKGPSLCLKTQLRKDVTFVLSSRFFLNCVYIRM